MKTTNFAYPKQRSLNDHLLIAAKIECCICGESWQGDDHVASDIGSVVKDATDYFYKAGWREKASGKFQVIGAMCPTCAKTKDSDRDSSTQGAQ